MLQIEDEVPRVLQITGSGPDILNQVGKDRQDEAMIMDTVEGAIKARGMPGLDGKSYSEQLEATEKVVLQVTVPKETLVDPVLVKLLTNP